MEDENTGMKERWAPPSGRPEQGYAGNTPQSPGEYATLPGDADVIGRENDDDPRTRDIRHEIDRTRGEMSETIDEIQDRLTPRNVVSRAAGSLRDAAVDKARDAARAVRGGRHMGYGSGRDGNRDGFFALVRDNPIPAAIAAASLAWLAFGGRRHHGNDRDRAIYGSTRDGDAFVRETRIAMDDVDEPGVHDDRSGIRSAVGDGMQSTVRHAGARVRDMSSRGGTRVRHAADRNPLAAGAAAAALGLAIGLLIPETERENEVMGEARDSLMERGRETVREAADKVKETAGEMQKVASTVLGGGASGSQTPP